MRLNRVSFEEERPHFGRKNSNNSDSDSYSEILDPDDPRVTKITKRCLDDYGVERRNALRQMGYRQCRKEQQKIRIEFNVTCEFRTTRIASSDGRGCCSYFEASPAPAQTRSCPHDFRCTIPPHRIAASGRSSHPGNQRRVHPFTQRHHVLLRG